MTIAYLDPGSGSLIASVLVGGAAAAGVAMKQARHRFTSRFSRRRGDSSAAPETGPESGADTQADAETEVGTDLTADPPRATPERAQP